MALISGPGEDGLDSIPTFVEEETLDELNKKRLFEEPLRELEEVKTRLKETVDPEATRVLKDDFCALLTTFTGSLKNLSGRFLAYEIEKVLSAVGANESEDREDLRNAIQAVIPSEVRTNLDRALENFEAAWKAQITELPEDLEAPVELEDEEFVLPAVEPDTSGSDILGVFVQNARVVHDLAVQKVRELLVRKEKEAEVWKPLPDALEDLFVAYTNSYGKTATYVSEERRLFLVLADALRFLTGDSELGPKSEEEVATLFKEKAIHSYNNRFHRELRDVRCSCDAYIGQEASHLVDQRKVELTLRSIELQTICLGDYTLWIGRRMSDVLKAFGGEAIQEAQKRLTLISTPMIQKFMKEDLDHLAPLEKNLASDLAVRVAVKVKGVERTPKGVETMEDLQNAITRGLVEMGMSHGEAETLSKGVLGLVDKKDSTQGEAKKPVEKGPSVLRKLGIPLLSATLGGAAVYGAMQADPAVPEVSVENEVQWRQIPSHAYPKKDAEATDLRWIQALSGVEGDVESRALAIHCEDGANRETEDYSPIITNVSGGLINWTADGCQVAGFEPFPAGQCINEHCERYKDGFWVVALNPEK